ncbi:MAG: carboxymuconolactone decarboxylase family protein [Phenylobacterium sp.]
MTNRLNLYAPEGKKPLELMYALEAYIKESSLDPMLVHLVKVRASQINGCAYCLHMHTADALKAGETPARLFLLDAWHESHLYTPRERAALTWTESLTRIAETHAPDADYEAVAAQFNAQELVDLTLLITTINAWNRLAIGFRGQHPNDVMKKAA